MTFKMQFVGILVIVALCAGVLMAQKWAEDSVHYSGQFGNLMFGVRNDTLAALAGTDGDLAPFQFNASGALYTAETSGATIAGDTTAIQAALEADGWTVATKAINVPAGATTELVGTAGTGKKIRVVGLMGVANVAGTVTLKSDSTAISGVIPVTAKGGWILSPIPAQNIPLHGWCETAANKDLDITTATCEFDGMLIYATQD